MKKTRVSGPLYGYLGHFAQPKYLDMGHNDIRGRADKGKGPMISLPDQENARSRREERMRAMEQPEAKTAPQEEIDAINKQIDSDYDKISELKKKNKLSQQQAEDLYFKDKL